MPVKKIIKILWSYIHSPIDFSGNLLLCCWNTFISGWGSQGEGSRNTLSDCWIESAVLIRLILCNSNLSDLQLFI